MATRSSSALPIPTVDSARWVSGAPWRLISTSVHGVLDYLTGLLLMILPFLPGFPRGTPPGGMDDFTLLNATTYAMCVPVILGGGTVLYSLLTHYEAGLVPMIPMPMHLVFDFLGGVLLAASPWLFHFHAQIYLPHLLIGLFEIAVALFTNSRPFARTVTRRMNPPNTFS